MTVQAASLSPAGVSETTEEDAIYRKINWRIVPIILFAYILVFLDRINVGFTQLQMKQDLDFSDGVFGLGAGLFFITYLMFEVPSNDDILHIKITKPVVTGDAKPIIRRKADQKAA